MGPKKIDKVEAIKVLSEINRMCKSYLLMCINIDQPSSQIVAAPTGYQIKMNCDLDKYSRKCISPIIDKYDLSLKKEKGFFILFKP